MEKGDAQLLQWAIENSNKGPQSDSQDDTHPSQPPRGLSQDAIRSLMGGPSDADLMKEAMTVIVHPEADLDSKNTAFDNFEQLIENLDNANNMEPLGLWPPLLALLSSPEASLRKMAAWCAGTAVQNNEKCQAFMLKQGGVAMVCKLAVEDSDPAVRRKAVYALSSVVRNYQPGLDEAQKNLPKNITGPDALNASDMDSIDAVMQKLREG